MMAVHYGLNGHLTSSSMLVRKNNCVIIEVAFLPLLQAETNDASA